MEQESGKGSQTLQAPRTAVKSSAPLVFGHPHFIELRENASKAMFAERAELCFSMGHEKYKADPLLPRGPEKS